MICVYMSACPLDLLCISRMFQPFWPWAEGSSTRMTMQSPNTIRTHLVYKRWPATDVAGYPSGVQVYPIRNFPNARPSLHVKHVTRVNCCQGQGAPR